MKNKTTLLISTLLTILSSTTLFGTNIQHTGLDWDRAMTIEIKADGNVRNANAGVGVLLVNGADYVDALCVNLFQAIYLNTTYAAQSIAPASYDVDGGNAPAYLAERYLSASLTDVGGAALQLAVWDLIDDGGDGFAAGRIRSTANTNGSVLAQANNWRMEAMGQSGAASIFTAAPGTTAFQQQIYLTGNPGGGEVPEPGKLVMLVVGVAGVAFGSWSRNRAAAR
ncbi:MAG: hypothetical protein FJW31_07530 [Acidobacteria bacterium]|nr:hypothetical protein [Acidobacteriota bacterium]